MASIYSALRDVVVGSAARALTGRWVKVLFQEPPLAGGVRGLAFRNDNGRGVIFIDPDLSQDQTLKTFLHETSHVKLDYAKLMHVKNAKSLEGRYMSEVRTMPKQRENKAADLAQSWYEMAKDLSPGGDFLKRLATLARYVSKGS